MMKLDGPDYQRQLSAESEKSPQIFLLFMFVGLFVGSVITYILTRYAKGFPYTVIIFLVGILAAVIDNYSAVTVIGNSLDMWIEFPPDLIIFIFLPVLSS
jgi:F0F1-type ATP synthase assembly protein I